MALVHPGKLATGHNRYFHSPPVVHCPIFDVGNSANGQAIISFLDPVAEHSAMAVRMHFYYLYYIFFISRHMFLLRDIYFLFHDIYFLIHDIYFSIHNIYFLFHDIYFLFHDIYFLFSRHVFLFHNILKVAQHI
ncbi:hypothetical protein DFH07DRAFT_540981 [Mycena maculata]|uniref:Uncharacterized protein n=1 Tax=Mycena maculata TaxID=230809 RepID=A0AAD7K5I1_9AGAR|nr:hypothetical protein DFH07DRAFT_540981 [Mycena maculata]